MPNRWAVASGNWSNTATWNNGAVLLLPTASDVVFTNGFNVTIDQPNITVIQLRNTATSSVAEGGTFISTNNIQITASGQYGIHASTSSLACFIITGSHFVAISGSILGPNGGFANSRNGVLITNGGTASIVGDVFGGSAAGGSGGLFGLRILTGSAFITGSLRCINNTGNTESSPLAINFGTASISGTLQSATNNSPITVYAGNAQVNFTGDAVINGTSTYNMQIFIAGNNTGTINYTGPVIGNNNAGIGLSGAGNTMTVNITGSVSTRGAASGIISSSPTTINVSGSIASGRAAPGLQSTSTSGLVRVTGPLINQNNINAVYSPRIQWISSSATYYDIQSETFNQDVILYDPAYPITFPPTSSVRSGSLYGATNQLTGSMIVPVPSNVRYGVPVDNTTGSATLTPQDVFDFATQNLTGSNTIGARLQNISTVQTTAATIAAFKGK